MVEVFREVRRVLRSDGTLWLNLGDTYCGTGHKGDTKDRINGEGRNGQRIAINNKVQGLKQKEWQIEGTPEGHRPFQKKQT